MQRYLVLFLCILALLFYGCSSSSSSKRETISLSPEHVQDLVRDNQDGIRSMKCEGQISFESKELSQSGSFVLTLKKPDSILITLKGPFGIKIGSALVTRDNFLFYNSIQNKLISGETSAENLGRSLQIHLQFDDLVHFISGGSFLTEDRRTPDSQITKENSIVFEYSSPISSRSYWIDPESLLIQKIQFFDRTGKLTLEESFDKFDTEDGVILPHRIRLTQFTSRRRALTLNYSRTQVNIAAAPCAFTYPETAEHIRW
jgi:outer membrane lipoprotein-sorting protein